jgi:tetratricopeptide (TPR) repeat protein
MRFGFLALLCLSLNFASPALRADDCSDDPTISPFLRALDSDPHNIDDMYNLAIAYYKKAATVEPGQANPCLDGAIDSFKRFLRAADGKDVPSEQTNAAYGVLGILVFQYKGDAEEGLKYFKKAIEIKSDDKESVYGAALALLKLNKDDEGVSYLKKAVTLDPDNAEYNYKYAATLNDLDGDKPTEPQSQELIHAWSGMVQAGKGNPDQNHDYLIVAYNALAQLYRKSGETDKAIDALTRADKLDPNDYDHHFLLGLLYSDQKNYLKMVDEYEKAVSIKPDKEDARYNLAAAYKNQEQYAKAYEQLFYITTNINKEDSQVLVLQAQMLGSAVDQLTTEGTSAMTANDFVTAKNDFEEVLKIDPNNSKAQKYLDEANAQVESQFNDDVKKADKLAAHGHKVDAAELYDEALSLKPDDEDVKAKSKKLGADISQLVSRLLSQGDAAFKGGDFDTAESIYKRVMQFKQGKERAEARLAKVEEKFKTDFSKKMHQGHEALEDERLSDARSDFEAAHDIDKESKDASAALIQVNQKIQDKIKKLAAQAEGADGKAAKTKLYNRILALDPNNADAASHIKSLTGTEAKAKVNADQIKALYYQGVDQYVNNNIKAAIATWQKLLTLDPSNEAAKNNILRANTKLKALEMLSKG